MWRRRGDGAGCGGDSSKGCVVVKLHLLLAGAVALAACGPAVDEGSHLVETQSQPILGGATSMSDPQVFLLLSHLVEKQAQSICTATLIGPRTLLTAAHCVDFRGEGEVRLVASNRPNARNLQQTEVFRVVETVMHPSWDPNQVLNDVALARLDRAPSVPVKVWNREDISTLRGRSLRSVGYGRSVGNPEEGEEDVEDDGTLIKRTVSLNFGEVARDRFRVGDEERRGICQGDSGGPSFYTFPDGVERVVGIHSYTERRDCLLGADARVDYHQQFISKVLAGWEDARCAADNQCNAACPNVASDPDCPRECAADGICSRKACPTPDPDCVPDGKVCTRADQCTERLCVVDPQKSESYCTRTCRQQSDCAAGLQCNAQGGCERPRKVEKLLGDRCTEEHFCRGGVCEGQSADTRVCSSTCRTSSECPKDHRCETGISGASYCRKMAVELTPIPPKLGNAAPSQSCSATSGAPFVLLGLLALRRGRSGRRNNF
jgi:hypothetical protein